MEARGPLNSELLETYAGIMADLENRDLVVNGSVEGGVAERLVCHSLQLERAPRDNAGFDGIDRAAGGIRYQIKGSRVQEERPRLSPIGGRQQTPFEFLVAVLFDLDFNVRLALKIPFAVIQELVGPDRSVNGYQLRITQTLQDHNNVCNISQRICRVDQLP